MFEPCRKLDLRFLLNKTGTFLVSVTHLILRFAILQNKFQQTNKTKINHINDNHIKFEFSLHFLGDLAYCAPCHLRATLSRQLKSSFPLLTQKEFGEGDNFPKRVGSSHGG